MPFKNVVWRKPAFVSGNPVEPQDAVGNLASRQLGADYQRSANDDVCARWRARSRRRSCVGRSAPAIIVPERYDITVK